MNIEQKRKEAKELETKSKERRETKRIETMPDEFFWPLRRDRFVLRLHFFNRTSSHFWHRLCCELVWASTFCRMLLFAEKLLRSFFSSLATSWLLSSLTLQLAFFLALLSKGWEADGRSSKSRMIMSPAFWKSRNCKPNPVKSFQTEKRFFHRLNILLTACFL